MIHTILEKVLSELNKPQPDMSYVKGMIEALAILEPTKLNEAQRGFTFPSNPIIYPPYVVTNSTNSTEAEVLDAKAKAALQRVQSAAHVELA